MTFKNKNDKVIEDVIPLRGIFTSAGGENMAIDPVCGMKVNENDAFATSTYNGQTYYFCSKHCQIAFDKNPEKYLKNKEDKGHTHCC